MTAMPSLRLHCSQAKQKKPFTPLDPQAVRMYVCGPTVYSTPHIGNARPCVVFDVLYRVLLGLYPKVVYCRNITDVDDKINKAAKEENVSIEVIAKRYTAAYHEDAAALGCLRPTIEPRATDHIAEMIALTTELLNQQHAYVSEGHVLFSVQSYADYGKVSGRSLEQLLRGARVEVAAYKKHPGDFVLWKPAKDGEPGWQSPWGFGRPGWHLECTAMIDKHLGLPFDIHGGGGDLLFPHHENECAQGICLGQSKSYCSVWMHNGMITYGNEKISKSIGNILTVRALLAQAPGEAVRLVLLQTHYRSPLTWKASHLEQAKTILDKAYRSMQHLATVDMGQSEASWQDLPSEIKEALQDDLNTPLALAHWQKLVKEAGLLSVESFGTDAARTLKRALCAVHRVLGLCQERPTVWFKGAVALDEPSILELLAKRQKARTEGNYAQADAIRAHLKALGIIIEDKHGDTTWRVE